MSNRINNKLKEQYNKYCNIEKNWCKHTDMNPQRPYCNKYSVRLQDQDTQGCLVVFKRCVECLAKCGKEVK